MVAINGNPTQASAAFSAVFAASLANGGSLNNITPGIDYFKKLHYAGNFVPVAASAATMESGQTPIVVWWDYLLASEIGPSVNGLKIVIPSRRSYAAYYDQAISKSRAGPGRGPAVGGVPVLHRGPEPLAPGRGPADRAAHPGGERHGQQGRVRGAAAGPGRQAHLPDPGAAGGGRERRVPAVVQRDRLAVDQTVAASGPRDPGGSRGPRGPAPGRRLTVPHPALAAPDRGIVPFGVYMTLGLLLPMIAVAIGAFQNGNSGAFTFSNVSAATHGIYLQRILAEHRACRCSPPSCRGSSGC